VRAAPAHIVALLLCSCTAKESAADIAEDVADDTARRVAQSAAAEAVEEQLTDVRARLDALEAESGNNLRAHVDMMNAVIESAKGDREHVEKIREGYNEHLRAYHGAR
jgi:Skp family chaperone for outer membrane proteins